MTASLAASPNSWSGRGSGVRAGAGSPRPRRRGERPSAVRARRGDGQEMPAGMVNASGCTRPSLASPRSSPRAASSPGPRNVTAPGNRRPPAERRARAGAGRTRALLPQTSRRPSRPGAPPERLPPVSSGAGLVDQPAEREAPSFSEAERRGHGEWAVHELRVRRDDLDRDPVLGHSAERERCFEPRNSGSGYEDVRRRHVTSRDHWRIARASRDPHEAGAWVRDIRTSDRSQPRCRTALSASMLRALKGG